MDSHKHAQLTGSDCRISRRVGGRFSLYGGDISGENLELIPDHKIVQSWRYADWPEGVFSKAAFVLEKTETGTRLTFTQSGVPDDKYADIKQGWKDYYWSPLRTLL
ncbi:MAG TPA: SRPBCC domain-containing protein [Dehalococcoidales bacterium]|nr:SRPBCC domain-containing protein [Dehalococcoidales bacterium]